jgi:ATP-dependent RNA helicase DHX8/PRP22
MELSKFPLEPSYSKALISSKFMKCEYDMITLVSMLSTENIWQKVSKTNES